MRIVTDQFGKQHDLGHEREYVVGERVNATNYTGEHGVIIGEGHIQPRVEKGGYDGQQTFPATRWYVVRLDSGKVEQLDPSRMSPERAA